MTYRSIALCLAAFTALAAPAMAEDGPQAPVTILPLVIETPAAPKAPALTPQSDAALDAMAGRQDTTRAMTEQDLTAISSGNRISANVVGSGAISLQDNALSSFNGIGNFTMNTGHNNTLQSSMSVTVIVTH